MTPGFSRSPLARLTAWSAAHPVPALIGAVCVLGLSILSISRMRIDASVHAMLGEHTPSAAALSRLAEDYPAADELYVLATLPEWVPDLPEALTAFAVRLETEVRQRPGAGAMVTHFRWHADPELTRFVREVVIPNGAYYLSDAAWDEFLHRLTPEGMRVQIARDEALMAAPGPAAAALAERLVRDPLRLLELVPGGADPSSRPDEEPRPELSVDGRTLLIRVGGARPSSDLEFAARFCEVIDACVARVHEAPLTVELAGGYAIAARTSTVIRADSIVSTLVSVALLHVLFAVLYRRWLAPLIILGVAGLGITAGFGVHAAAAATITPLTAVIAAMLAGLGVDYGIHFLSHYQSHRAEGAPAIDAATTTAAHLGLPIVTNALTTVFGFASLWFASVAMLRDFALLGTLGLLGCLAATFVVLPALLVLADRRAGLTPPRFASVALPAVRRPGACITVAGVLLVVVVGGAGVRGVFPGLEADLTVMHPRPNRPLELTNALSARFAGAPETIPVEIAATPDPVSAAHRLARALDTPVLRAAGVVPERTVGLHSLLPDPGSVAARRDTLESRNADAVIAAFDAAIDESIFDPAAFGEYRELLRALVTAEPPGLDELNAYPAVKSRFFPGRSPDESGRTLLAVALDGPLTDRDRRDSVVGALRDALREHPEATPTGMSVVGCDLERATRADLPRSVGVSVVLVLAWLVLVFRRPGDVALALIPLAFAIVFTIAFLTIAGQRFNPINAVALPLLDGIAVDAGVFLVAAARSGTPGRPALAERFRTTGPAVLAAALTTVAGFAALTFTRTPAVRSLGLAASVGILASLAGAMLLLAPLLLRRARRVP